MIRSLHKESLDPMKLDFERRNGIYEARAAMFLPYVEGKDLIEIGCGYGYDASLFSKKAKSVVAIDINRTVIDEASKRYRNINNLTFISDHTLKAFAGKRTFDIVISFESLEHLNPAEQVALLEESWAILRPNGQLFLSTPNGQFVPFYRKNPYHKKELNIQELKTLVSCYFEINEMKGQVHIGWLFLPVPWVAIEKIWSVLKIYRRISKLRNRVQTSRTILIRATKRALGENLPQDTQADSIRTIVLTLL